MEGKDDIAELSKQLDDTWAATGGEREQATGKWIQHGVESIILTFIGNDDVQYSQVSKAGPKLLTKKAKKSGEGATEHDNAQVESPTPKKLKKKKAAKKASRSEIEVKP